MSYNIPENLQKLEEKIKNLEERINAFENQLGTVSGDVVKSGTDKEIPVVESETVSGPVILPEVNVNPLVGNVKAKVEAIEQNVEKNKIITTNDLLTEQELDILGPEKFGTNLTVINKFLNILTIIVKISNNADAGLKSKLDDNLKEKYITKGQTLFDETTKYIKTNFNEFCKNKDAINAYFYLYNIILKFYSNLIKKPSPYGNLYEKMKGTKNSSNNGDFKKYINNLLIKNNTNYIELKTILFENKCIGNENFNVENTKGGRKSRKIKHRKTKRRGKGHKKSHKKRHSKSHKKRH